MPEESNERPSGPPPFTGHRQSIDGFSRRPVQPLPQRPTFDRPSAPVPPVTPAAETIPLPAAPAPSVQPEVPTAPPVEAAPPDAPFLPSEPQPTTQLAPEAAQTPQPIKSRRRLRLPKYVLIALLVLVLAAAAFAGLRYQAAQNKPDKVFRDALLNSLSSNFLAITTTRPAGTDKTNLDLSDLKNPIADSRVSLPMGGSSAELAGWGSAKNVYVSYVKLPAGIKPELASAVQNSWAQLRFNGILAPASSKVLVAAADPRQQAFGPVVWANLPDKERQQLVSFLIDHQVYKFDLTRVEHGRLDGAKVLIYSAKPDVGYLKIATQSAGNSEGFKPDDMQAAVGALDSLNGAALKLYVSAGKHAIVGVDVIGGSDPRQVRYNVLDKTAIGVEPQTKLNWQSFSVYHYQLEAGAAATMPAADQDKLRQENLQKLHGYLANYFAQNGNYPSLASLNNPSWAFQNLVVSDLEVLRDPLSPSLQLSNAPKAGAFAYQPVPASGKGLCDDSPAKACVHYKLTATLSNGQPFVVQDP